MKITLLGTGSPLPDAHRMGPSSLVGDGATQLLVDAGRGVVSRLVGAGVFPGQLSGVLLTHLHSDHVSDLNDVITTYWVMPNSGAPLTIVGPVGTRALVDATLAMLAADVSYRLAHHADLNEPPAVVVTEVEPGARLTLGAAEITVAATDHRPVDPSVAYAITVGDQRVVMAGDGVPCATLDELLRGATAYVQTVVRDDLVRQIPVPRLQDILDYHSSVEQAAQTAARAGVACLVLTHYVPAPAPGTEAEWVAGASAFFSGRIVAGGDLTSIDLNELGLRAN